MRVLAALLVPTALVAQNTWVVDPENNVGTHFTDLAPAVAAAAAGDTIMVLYRIAGTNAVHGATIDKPLRIIGFALPAEGPDRSMNALIVGRLEITGIGAGETCAVSSIALSPDQIGAPYGFHIHDCAGTVHLEEFRSPHGRFFQGLALIENCADVTIRNSGTIDDIITAPGSTITLRNSNVLIDGCWIDNLGVEPFFGPQHTFDTMRVDGGHVRLVNCLVDGYPRYQHPFSGLTDPARHAIVVDAGTLEIAPQCSLLGGSGGVNPVAGVDNRGGTVRADPRGLLHTGFGGPFTFTELAAITRGHAVLGDVCTMRVFGPPGGFALLFAGMAATSPVPTPFGPTALDLGWTTTLAIAPLTPNDGLLDTSWFVSPFLPMEDLFAIQGAVVDPAGTIGLTWPSRFTARWQAGSMP